MKKIVISILIIIVLLVSCNPSVENIGDDSSEIVQIEKETKTYDFIYNAPESQDDRRYNHQWIVLKMALDKTVDTYGEYELIPSVKMSEERQRYELIEKTGSLTIMYLDDTPSIRNKLIPIRIPIDKGLISFRVFLIKDERQHEFNDVTTLDELRNFSIGQGEGWIDVDILESNGFEVVTGQDYEGLFEMLINDRFDTFSRGANEILEEYSVQKIKFEELHIEENIALYFPLYPYYWFADNEQGRLQKERVEAGLKIMLEDGSFEKAFQDTYSESIEILNIKDRKYFEISNPFQSEEDKNIDKNLLFNPFSDTD